MTQSDALLADTETPAPVCEWRPQHLIIVPGLSYEEWEEQVWSGIKQTHESVNWLLGDALLYSERQHGERWSQAVDADHARHFETCRWVCSRIEPVRRRENLKWSVHRAVAVLDPVDQDALLDRAAAEHWNTQQTEEAKKALKAERAAAAQLYPRNGAPEGERKEEPSIPEGKGPANDADVDDAVTECEARFSTGERSSNMGGKIDIEELRAIIAEIRVLSHGISPNKYRLTETAERINEVCHLGQYPLAPLYEEIAALALIPRGWVMSSASGEPGSWSVELRYKGGGKFAVGTGPLLVLALTEAALAARISEASA